MQQVAQGEGLAQDGMFTMAGFDSKRCTIANATVQDPTKSALPYAFTRLSRSIRSPRT